MNPCPPNPHPSILEKLSQMEPQEREAYFVRWHLDSTTYRELVFKYKEEYGPVGPLKP